MTTPGEGPYRLLALDLDGTIVNKELQVSARVQEAIRAAVARGIQVTIASGRMFTASLPYARLLGLQTPLICYQGAMLADPGSGEILYHQGVPVDLAREVIRICQAAGLHVNVYLDDKLYVERLTPEADLYVRRMANVIQPHVVGDLARFLDREPTKLLIVSDPAVSVRLVSELSARFDGQLYVARSQPEFTEVAHPDISKSRGLAMLAQRLGIPQAGCMAIGDGLNDLDMIVWAGLGVALGGSLPALIEAADYVTGTIEEDGVATAIERFILPG